MKYNAHKDAARMCKIVTDDGKFVHNKLVIVAGAGRSKMTSFQHLFITITLNTAAISVEDSDKASGAVILKCGS